MITLTGLIILIVVVALIMWLIPMNATLQKVLIAVVVVFALLFLLSLFGVLPAGHGALR